MSKCSKCNRCNEGVCRCVPSFCGCKIKLDARCVNYSGDDMEPIGIIKGDTIHRVLNRINKLLSNILDSVSKGFIFKNIGRGAKVYMEDEDKGKVKFRTLEGSDLIEVIEGEEVIQISIDRLDLERIIDEIVERRFLEYFSPHNLPS